MDAFKKQQRIVAVVFIFLIVSYFIANITIQYYELYYGFKAIKPNNVADSIAQTEDVINRSAYRREDLVNLYSYIQVLLNKEENGSFDLVKATDGSLHYGEFYSVLPEALEEYVIRLRRLKEYASSKGCEVIFINTLPLHTTGYTTYSAGLPYKDENPTMDTILFYMQGYGLDYLDLRESLKQSDLEPEKYRYKTDHHWTIEASFEGFKALVKKLSEQYGHNIDPENFYTNPNNYSHILYRDSLTGTLGHRAGAAFSGSEDFTLILPNFPTSFYTEIDNGDGTESVEGDFTTALINKDYLETYNMYLAYMDGLSVYKRIVNLNNKDGLNALFVHDSAALPLAAFMAPACSEIEMLYPLSQSLFGYSVDIKKHIEDNIERYDYIFIELIPNNFNENAFSFLDGKYNN